MIKCKTRVSTSQNTKHKSFYMYHPRVEYIYKEIKHVNWIIIRSNENDIDFFQVKTLTHLS